MTKSVLLSGNVGFLNGKFYDIDLEFLSERRQVKIPVLTKELQLLDREDYIIYVPPFRGKPTKLLGGLDLVDFDKLSERKAAAVSRLSGLVTFCGLTNDQKHKFLSSYFS